jgi:hypothetical protein
MNQELATILQSLSNSPDQPGLINKFIELTLDLDVASDVKVSNVMSMLYFCAQIRASSWQPTSETR